VAPIKFEDIQKVIEEDFAKPINEIFSFVDPVPLAAASIAQVHAAKLKTGEDVVIKVQRPGIIEIIQNDLSVLYTIAGLLERYVPESRSFNPQAVVDEFFKTLELETNFIVEANNIKRIALNFKNDPHILIPYLYSDYSTPRVLVMTQLKGIPLSDTKRLLESKVDRERIVSVGLRAFFQMVFKDGIFHGDLHAGNLFVLEDNKIGLVDFGVVGRLSNKTRDAIANMLVAMATEDYEALTYEYLELAPYNNRINMDQFTREIRDLLAPYYGMTFKDMNFGRLLLDSTSIAAKHKIIMPSELMLFFKALVTIEGMGRTIIEDFDMLTFALEFAQEIVKHKYDPERIMKDLIKVGHDSASLAYSLPRQIKQLIRKVNSNDFAIDMNITQIEDLKRSIETSGNLVYLGLVIAALIIASAMTLTSPIGPHVYGLPLISLVGFGLSSFMALLAFYNYVRK
jgi:ubiquinone biosynthesis protein